MEITGYVCGYLASVFYLCSRFPQIHKNVSNFFFFFDSLYSQKHGLCVWIGGLWKAQITMYELVINGDGEDGEVWIFVNNACVCQNESQALKTMALLC